MDDPTRRSPEQPDPQQALQRPPAPTQPMQPAHLTYPMQPMHPAPPMQQPVHVQQPMPMQQMPMQQMPMQQPMMVQSLPGMPPIQHVSVPGVSVHISNVVGHAPAYPMTPYGPPGYPAPPQPYPHQQLAPHADPSAQGVVGVMRQDAAQRTMEAVQRRGPARVLGYSIGYGMLALMVGLLCLLPLGAPFFAVLLAELPCAVIAVGAFVMGRRAGEGVSSHHLEQAILRVAAEHDGVVKVVTLAQSTGRPLRECQLAIDAMVASGHATVDSDDRGVLLYRIPDLEPAPIKGELT